MKLIIAVVLMIVLVQSVLGAAFVPQRKHVGFDGTPEIKCGEGSARCLGRVFQRCANNDWSAVETCAKTLRCNYKKGCVGSPESEKKVLAAKERAQKKTVQKTAGISHLKI